MLISVIVLKCKTVLIRKVTNVAVNRGYDTCFRKRLVMGYADCSDLVVQVETPC